MTTCYVFHFSELHIRGIPPIITEIKTINPDIIIALCAEEFDYNYIFKDFYIEIESYLKTNNKKINLIAPYVDKENTPDYVIVEESFGYYYQARNIAKRIKEEGLEFSFKDTTKLFSCYNNNPKPHRLLLVDTLAKYDLIKDGIVTLHYPNDYTYKYHDGSELFDEPNFKLGSAPEITADKLPRSYLNGFIDIVTESTYEAGQFNLTEKTCKPIGALKPFLVAGPPRYHEYLHNKYGLRYYNDLFDYSFDLENDLEKRIEGLVHNIIKLSKLSNSELKELYERVKPVAVANRYIFLNDHNDYERIVPDFIKSLNNDNISWFGSTHIWPVGMLPINTKKVFYK